jgi:hypothetical protein
MNRVSRDEIDAILAKLQRELNGLANTGSPVAQDILEHLCTDDDGCRHGGRWCDKESRKMA